MRTKHTRVLIVAGLTMLAACNNSLAPFQPEITNAPNNFQAQATGLQNVSTTLDYVWQNDGTTANVNQSTVLTTGSAVLTISDANHTQVYTHDLTANGTFVTSAGTAGNWTIHVVVTSASGTLNFRVQKP